MRDGGLFVYALYKDGVLIYVGRTGNLRCRLQAHMRRFVFDIAKFSMAETSREARWRERRLLYRLRPCLNRIIPSDLCGEFYHSRPRRTEAA